MNNTINFCNGESTCSCVLNYKSGHGEYSDAADVTLCDLHSGRLYIRMIGKKVRKTSPKPFKSGKKVNTVKSIVMHPILKDVMAFTFEEDDSIVECRRCAEVKK